MSFGAAVKSCFRQYAVFEGRARRSEFWFFYLFNVLISLPLTAIFYAAFLVEMFANADAQGNVDPADVNWGVIAVPLALLVLLSLALFLPWYAVQVRRLHDMGQPGLWVLLNFVGFGIVPLIMCIMESQPGPNQWGPNPRGEGAPAPGPWTPPPS